MQVNQCPQFIRDLVDVSLHVDPKDRPSFRMAVNHFANAQIPNSRKPVVAGGSNQKAPLLKQNSTTHLVLSLSAPSLARAGGFFPSLSQQQANNGNSQVIHAGRTHARTAVSTGDLDVTCDLDGVELSDTASTSSRAMFGEELCSSLGSSHAGFSERLGEHDGRSVLGRPARQSSIPSDDSTYFTVESSDNDSSSSGWGTSYRVHNFPPSTIASASLNGGILGESRQSHHSLQTALLDDATTLGRARSNGSRCPRPLCSWCVGFQLAFSDPAVERTFCVEYVERLCFS